MRASIAPFAVALAFASNAAAAPGAAIVRTESGLAEGGTDHDLRIFKGLPYAKAPLGDLRWRAPQPAAKWSGVRPARDFGASCMQPATPPTLPPPMATVETEKTISEDCLFLNIWAPTGARKAPVMVSIHGGGFFMGSGSWERGDGAPFAREGVVVVSINYRLGVFGFFAHPELTAEAKGGVATNFGILDQIAALRWVRRNIIAFGGDPDNVTIFGGSAGGRSVNTLMISPLSKGLFARAIATSSVPTTNQTTSHLHEPSGGQPSAEQWGVDFAKKAGAADLRALRATPAGKLFQTSLVPVPSMGMSFPVSPGVVIDGKSIPMGEAEAFRAGLQHKLPYLNGADNFEAAMAAGFPAWSELENKAGDRLSAVRGAYDPAGTLKPEDVRIMMATDVALLKPSQDLARDMRRIGIPGYTYVFSYVPERVRSLIAGAWHTAEYAYTQNLLTLRSDVHGAPTPQDIAISRSIRSYWLNFVRTGNPGNAGGPEWQDANVGTMLFANDGPHFVADYLGPRMTRLEAVLDRRR